MTVHLHGDHHAPERRRAADDVARRPGRHGPTTTRCATSAKARAGSFYFYHDHRMDGPRATTGAACRGCSSSPTRRRRSSGLPTGAATCRCMSPTGPSARTTSSPTRSPTAAQAGHHGEMAWMTGPKAPPERRDGRPRRSWSTAGSRRTSPSSAARYRLRLLNASHFSAYDFALSDGSAVRPGRHRQRPAARAGGRGRTCCSGRPSAPTSSSTSTGGRPGHRARTRSRAARLRRPAPARATRRSCSSACAARRADRSRVPGEAAVPRLHPGAEARCRRRGPSTSASTRSTTASFWSVNGKAFDPEPGGPPGPARHASSGGGCATPAT